MKPFVSDSLLRAALWTTAGMNLAVALLLLNPQSAAGRLAGLPQEPAPAVYAALLAAMIALFGGAYAWLARAARIDRPLLALAAIGKSSAFLIVFALWAQGLASGRFTALMVGDLLFAAIFAAWLLGSNTRDA
jgi:hypothetical protein